MFPSMVARRCSYEAPTGTRLCLSVCLSACLSVCMSVCVCLFVWQSPPLFVCSLIAFVLYDVTHYMSKYVSISDWDLVEISTLSVKPCPLKVNGQVQTHTLAFWKVNIWCLTLKYITWGIQVCWIAAFPLSIRLVSLIRFGQLNFNPK